MKVLQALKKETISGGRQPIQMSVGSNKQTKTSGIGNGTNKKRGYQNDFMASINPGDEWNTQGDWSPLSNIMRTSTSMVALMQKGQPEEQKIDRYDVLIQFRISSFNSIIQTLEAVERIDTSRHIDKVYQSK